MFVIIGYIVVCSTIFGGYALAGGHLGGLWQPLEVLMIFGGALGAFIVGNDAKALKATMKALPSIFKGSKYNKALYLDLLALKLNKTELDLNEIGFNKVLSTGKLTRPLTIKAKTFTPKAKAKIEEAGGQVVEQ